ncbi:MAG: tetratricopeptide repeat protein [Thermodesulfobacteriota bacterium]
MKLGKFAPILVFLLMQTVVGADDVSEFERGIALRIEGKPRKAVEALRKVRPGSADYLRAQVQIGACLEDLGNPKEAEKTYLGVLAVDPYYGSAKRNLEHLTLVKTLKTPVSGAHPARESILHTGLRALEAKDYARALEIFRMSRGLVPKDPRPLFYSALTMERQGFFTEARALYESVLRNDHTFVPARVNLVVLLLERGDPEGARKALDFKDSSLDRDPRLNYLARILAEKAPTFASERAAIVRSQDQPTP